MTHLPPVAVKGLAAFESQPNLSWAVFTRPLTPAEQEKFTAVVDDFYSESLGGFARPMIYAEFTEDGFTVHFRTVTGREAPSEELFGQLLVRLSESKHFRHFVFDFSLVFERSLLVSTARTAPPLVNPKYELRTDRVRP